VVMEDVRDAIQYMPQPAWHTNMAFAHAPDPAHLCDAIQFLWERNLAHLGDGDAIRARAPLLDLDSLVPRHVRAGVVAYWRAEVLMLYMARVVAEAESTDGN